MAFTVSHDEFAAREGAPDTMSDVENVVVSPPALFAPREGERAEDTIEATPPSNIEDSRKKGWHSAWNKTLVWFLKTLPEGLQTLRGMNATGEIDDDSMCSLAVSVFTEAEKAGSLKWPELQTCFFT